MFAYVADRLGHTTLRRCGEGDPINDLNCIFLGVSQPARVGAVITEVTPVQLLMFFSMNSQSSKRDGSWGASSYFKYVARSVSDSKTARIRFSISCGRTTTSFPRTLTCVIHGRKRLTLLQFHLGESLANHVLLSKIVVSVSKVSVSRRSRGVFLNVSISFRDSNVSVS